MPALAADNYRSHRLQTFAPFGHVAATLRIVLTPDEFKRRVAAARRLAEPLRALASCGTMSAAPAGKSCSDHRGSRRRT
jgi:hypothetical protein